MTWTGEVLTAQEIGFRGEDLPCPLVLVVISACGGGGGRGNGGDDGAGSSDLDYRLTCRAIHHFGIMGSHHFSEKLTSHSCPLQCLKLGRYDFLLCYA